MDRDSAPGIARGFLGERRYADRRHVIQEGCRGLAQAAPPVASFNEKFVPVGNTVRCPLRNDNRHKLVLDGPNV